MPGLFPTITHRLTVHSRHRSIKSRRSDGGQTPDRRPVSTGILGPAWHNCTTLDCTGLRLALRLLHRIILLASSDIELVCHNLDANLLSGLEIVQTRPGYLVLNHGLCVVPIIFSCSSILLSLLIRRDIHDWLSLVLHIMFRPVCVSTVISSDESITIFFSHTSTDNLSGLFQRDVHEAIDGLKKPCFIFLAINEAVANHGHCGAMGKGNTPLKTTPEFSFTVTGAPLISVKKPEGSLEDDVPFSII